MFKAELILKITRDDICDQQFFGFVNLFDEKKCLLKIGKDNNEPFFLRSLAKPLQVSVAVELGTYDFYKLTSREVAISTASHKGEKIHTKEVLNILNKAGLNEDYLQCGIHAPISDKVSIKKFKPINNNCSGKHALILLECRQMGFDLANYTDINHPIQKMILKQHLKLSKYKKDMPQSFDGCNLPVWALPFKNIAGAFLNLFLDEKYKILKNAFLKHPLLIGGEGRLDSAIIQKGRGNLIAKVGAGGFLCVVNIKEKQVLLIKMVQDNNTPRAILAQEILMKLGWIKERFINKEITTSNGIISARYETVGF